MTESPALTFSKACLDQLSPEDFFRIVELEKNCGLPDPYDPALIHALLTVADLFICRADGMIVGFVMIDPHSAYCGGSIYIVNINVGAPHRGRGIAKRMLLEACRHYAPLDPDAPVSLDVTRTNPARRLYRRVGFAETGIPSRNGPTDVVMTCPLTRLTARLEQFDLP